MQPLQMFTVRTKQFEITLLINSALTPIEILRNSASIAWVLLHLGNLAFHTPFHPAPINSAFSKTDYT